MAVVAAVSSATATLSTKDPQTGTSTNTSTTSSSFCPVCLDEGPTAGVLAAEDDKERSQSHKNNSKVLSSLSMVSLRPCNHDICMTCATDWFRRSRKIEKEPNCPQCRGTIDEEQVNDILESHDERTNTGEDKNNNNVEEEEEEDGVDEFTRTYLEEMGARKCQNCGAWIISEDGGEVMQCLCGHRFCWSCNRDDCGCIDGETEFYDNVIGEAVQTRGYDDEDDEEDDDSNNESRDDDSNSNDHRHAEATQEEILDLRSFMEQHRARVERRRRREEEEAEERSRNRTNNNANDVPPPPPPTTDTTASSPSRPRPVHVPERQFNFLELRRRWEQGHGVGTTTE